MAAGALFSRLRTLREKISQPRSRPLAGGSMQRNGAQMQGAPLLLGPVG